MLESNGELTDAGARAAAADGALRHGHRLPPPARWPSTSATATATPACDACDVCLGELEQAHDPVTVARKILSCVARVGQRFGATHVANVLRGHASEQVVARGHDQLSTFGLLHGAPAAEVRGYIEQLIGAGAAGIDRRRLPGAVPDAAGRRRAEGRVEGAPA